MKLYDPSLPSSKKEPQARLLKEKGIVVEPQPVEGGFYPVIEVGDKDKQMLDYLKEKGWKEVKAKVEEKPKPAVKTDAK